MRPTIFALLLAAITAASVTAASAQIVVAEKDDQKLTIGGFLQAQYEPRDRPPLQWRFI